MPTSPIYQLTSGETIGSDELVFQRLSDPVTLNQQTLGQELWPRTSAEIAAGVVPTDYSYEPGNVLRYGVNTTPGTTDMTSAVQAAIDGNPGGVVTFPAESVKHGPVDVDSSVYLSFPPGCVIVPSFDSGTSQKLYNVTVDDVTVDGLVIGTTSGTISANKYLVYATGCDNLTVKNCRISSVTISDGNLGATNLLVCHAFYFDDVTNARIINNSVNLISGAAVFWRQVVNGEVGSNHFTDTRWYSINIESDCENVDIHHNTIDGTNTNSRNWGGSVNIQSSTNGNPNKRIDIRYNWITGVHNYGSAIRIQSLLGGSVVGNQVYDCTAGALAPGGGTTLNYISLDRRGTAEGQPENGPCKNITISRNVITADGPNHEGIYLKNQYKATRDPHQNISVIGNVINSPSLTDFFEMGISVHGYKSGFERVLINSNIVEVLTDTGAAVGGAIGVVSTNSDGKCQDVTITDNSIVDIKTDLPSNTSMLGVYIQQTADNVRVQNNVIRNFYYAVRTTSGADVIGTDDNIFDGNLLDVLDQAPSRSGWDYSKGNDLPVTGVYRVGHVRQDTNAAASASWGWVCTTAGGAMTGLYANGATYTAGVWYRNASGRVYELITAGGGTTSVEPTHTTVGQDVTGADGYVWRCRATASARWAPLAALSAAAALP